MRRRRPTVLLACNILALCVCEFLLCKRAKFKYSRNKLSQWDEIERASKCKGECKCYISDHRNIDRMVHESLNLNDDDDDDDVDSQSK